MKPCDQTQLIFLIKSPSGYFKLLIRFQNLDKMNSDSFCQIICCFCGGTDFWISLLHHFCWCLSECFIVLFFNSQVKESFLFFSLFFFFFFYILKMPAADIWQASIAWSKYIRLGLLLTQKWHLQDLEAGLKASTPADTASFFNQKSKHQVYDFFLPIKYNYQHREVLLYLLYLLWMTYEFTCLSECTW